MNKGSYLGFVAVALVAAALAVLGLEAGPVRAQRPFTPSWSISPPVKIVPPATMPFVESPPAVPCVPLPPSLNSPTVEPSLQAPGTALDPRPGTGSGLISGLLQGGKMEVQHGLAPQVDARLGKIQELLSGLGQGKVSITPTLPPEISQSLSATSDRLNLLASLASVVLTIFGAGKVGPWVVLAVNGLRSFFAARSATGQQSAEVAALLEALKQLLAVNPAARSSTQKPAS